MAIAEPRVPHLRFEYHLQSRKVYYMPKPDERLAYLAAQEGREYKIEAKQLAQDVNTPAEAIRIVQVYARAFLDGQKEPLTIQVPT